MNRDRGKRIEMNGSVEEAVNTLDHFLNSESKGIIGFKKEGESVSLWCSSEDEPST